MNHLGKMRAARRRTRSLGALRARCLEALEQRYALAGDLGTAEAPAEGETPATEIKLGAIPGLDLKKALFAIWLGDSPVQESLKNALLHAK